MSETGNTGSAGNADTTDIGIRFGREELVISDRYEVVSIINDVMVALWFIVGSVLFFWTDTTTVGVWCFLLGSVQLLIRPVIRLSRRIHLVRLRQAHSSLGPFGHSGGRGGPRSAPLGGGEY